ncbi:MAG TPA: uracil-DNA glycosylase, partial [Kiloniellales bacterium]|nr:uracil-DNA glycosylase [Kiloniellales bacterium]
KAVFRRTVAIGRERGKWLPFVEGTVGFVTIHPSFILRQQDSESRAATYRGLVKDLRLIAQRIHRAAA